MKKITVYVTDCRKFFKNEKIDPIFGDACGVMINKDPNKYSLKCTLTYDETPKKEVKA